MPISSICPVELFDLFFVSKLTLISMYFNQGLCLSKVPIKDLIKSFVFKVIIIDARIPKVVHL